MDHAAFDRIARLAAAPLSRRAGILAALAAAAALSARPASAGKRCRDDRSACAKHGQCCSGYCDPGGKGKQAAAGAADPAAGGRCRCLKRGEPCGRKKTCCKNLTCSGGTCGRSGKDRKTRFGHACTPGGNPCDNPALCIPYYQAAPLGDYCLLRGGDVCRQNSECGSLRCDGGACWPEVCTVCAAGCAHATVQAAIDAAAPGSTIYIGVGVYAEDLVIPAKPLTLTNCNGGDVLLLNVADGARTIRYGDPADVAPHPTLTIRNLTVSGKAAPVAAQPAPAPPAVEDGGVVSHGHLVIEGRARVTGCNRLGDGGGVELRPSDEALMLTVRGQAEISGNYASGSGGGVSANASPASLLIYGKPKITGNVAGTGGGGVNALTVDIRGNAQIAGNTPDDCLNAPLAPDSKACGA
ncbi:MAG: hypothetical protein ACKOWF_10925 [Chloroflexota bacterium]